MSTWYDKCNFMFDIYEIFISLTLGGILKSIFISLDPVLNHSKFSLCTAHTFDAKLNAKIQLCSLTVTI